MSGDIGRGRGKESYLLAEAVIYPEVANGSLRACLGRTVDAGAVVGHIFSIVSYAISFKTGFNCPFILC